MKTYKIDSTRGIFAALILAIVAGTSGLVAADNIVALGRVASAGALLNSGNTVNGVVTSTNNGTGDYTVEVIAPGAFTGASVNDFIPQVTVNSTASGDETVKAHVVSVTDDIVSMNVHIDDVEDLTNPDLFLPINMGFYFTLYRVSGVATAGAGTRFLLGAGVVSSAGGLSSGAGVDGIVITTIQNATGDYSVTLSKSGAFSGDVNSDYVLSLSVRGSGTQDEVVRGGVSDTGSNDQVVFNVHTDDPQANPDASIAVPISRAFCFSVYKIAPMTGLPASQLLVALARVNSTGTLLSIPTAIDGGAINVVQDGVGDYHLTIVSPGAFAGRFENEFVAHVSLNQNNTADENIIGIVTLPDSNTLRVDINTNDVEQSGQISGVPTNVGFFLSVFDAKAVHQPDLRIGEKRSLTKMKGNDRYNSSGGGQQTKVKLQSTSRKKYFFALENDGNVSGSVRIKEKGAGKTVRTNYFNITNGRKNVSAKLRKAGHIEESVSPDAMVRYEGRVKYLSNNKRPGRKIRLMGTSLSNPSAHDTVRLKVIPR